MKNIFVREIRLFRVFGFECAHPELDADLEKQLRDWKDNMFSENDEPLARYLLYRLFKGRRDAQKFPYVLEWESNLISGGCVDKKTGKMYFNEKYFGIEFALLMNCALGYLKRTKVK